MKKVICMITFLILLTTNSLPAGSAEKQGRMWPDETVYSILIDRYLNADQSNDFNVDMNDPEAYHGGDLQGIIDKLDYIKDMGFTTILLSPIFNHTEGDYQGIRVSDFYAVDEHFGTMDQFKTLINEAHNRGVNVMIDFMISHVGSDHPWLNDSTKEGWLTGQVDDHLYEINLENQDASQYMIEAAKYWIEETDLDGYRLTSLDEIPVEFLQDFSESVKSVKESFYLLGDSRTDQVYIEAGMDGFTDYRLSEELRNVMHEPDHGFTDLFSQIENKMNQFENPHLIGTFLDNDRISRFTKGIIEQNEHPGPRWKQALTFLYTTPGIPIVFYGSEIALDGGEIPDNHRQMNFRTDPELVDYITQIGKLRSQLTSLTRGTLDVLYEKDGFSIYKRQYENEISVVAINNTKGTQTATIQAQELADDMELRGVLNGDLVRSQDKEYKITIDRDESEIYLLQPQTGINMTFILAIVLVPITFGVFLYLVWRKSRKTQS
ncbi:alpha-amylase family glycosyl hydrolase [Niallia sp. Krafla_26]|uniref:alpha-amylase family glycosyl hydrolase n=1 Tax=Niallia sp. Krafla_26 TaxID=3064703 RepID=UPI003D164769